MNKPVPIGVKYGFTDLYDLVDWIIKETGTTKMKAMIAARLRYRELSLDSTEERVRMWFPELEEPWKSKSEIFRELAALTGLTVATVTNYFANDKLNPLDENDIQKWMKKHGSEQAMSRPDKLGLRKSAVKRRNIIWQPDALPGEPPIRGKQWEFMEAPEDWVLIEGGKGSGKSDMLIFDCLRPEKITNPEWLGVIFRREYKRLVEIIDRAHRIMAKMPDIKAHWQGSDSRFIFPSGARMAFHNCENEGDEEKYQGWQIADLKFDQLEEMDEKQFDYLILQNRSGDPLKLRSTMRATANPGGAGHAWVKRRLVDQKPEGQTHYIRSDMPHLGEDYVKTYRRIHATVFDNPLLKHDRAYIATLATHPDPIKRKAMLDGDWNIVIGQFFTQFSTPVHVLPSVNAAGHEIKLDKSFERSAGFDYGNVKVMEFLARDYEGNVYVEHEFRTQPSTYKPGGLTASEFAEASAEFMLSRGLGYGLMVTADTNMWIMLGRDVDVDKIPANIIQDIWNRIFKKHDPNFRPPQLIPVSKKKSGEMNYRVACNEAIKDYLDYRIDPGGLITRQPRLFFMDRCTSITITLPNLQTDPSNPLDVLSDGNDHDYDAFKMPFMNIYKPRPAPRNMSAQELWDRQYAQEHNMEIEGKPAGLIDARSDF